MSILFNITYCLTFINLIWAAYDTIKKKDSKTTIRSLWLLIGTLTLLLLGKNFPIP